MKQKTTQDIPLATGNLRATQLRMVEILKEIDAVCRRHNLRYWIDYGTLLGAVRHGGFIPWDDDLDISVFEDDFEKLEEICKAELPDWLMVQSEKTDPQAGMGGGFFKIRDKRSLYINDFDSFRLDYNKGIFVDVFKNINYPRMSPSVFRYLSRRISFSYGFFHYPQNVNFKNILCYFLYPLSYVFHKGLFNLLYLFGKSDRYFFTPERYSYGLYSKKEDIFPLKDIEFEGHKFLAPSNTHQRLVDNYGDYMKIPDEQHRRTHAKFVLVNKEDGEVTY